MSAQERKEAGTTAPIIPREPQGCLPGFLRRFFRLTQASYQTPIGLEHLDTLVTKEVGIVQDIAGQAEIARAKKEREEAEKIAEFDRYMENCASERVKVGIQEFEELWPFVMKLRIRERLEYINASVWEGKGQVRDISTTPECITRDTTNRAEWRAEAGLELSYSFPSVGRKTEELSERASRWRYVQAPDSSSLRVVVVNRRHTPGGSVGPKENPFIEVTTSCYSFYSSDGGCRNGEIHLDSGDQPSNEGKLDQVLAKECAARIRENAVPSKLFLLGQEKLREAMASPQWRNWEISRAEYYGE